LSLLLLPFPLLTMRRLVRLRLRLSPSAYLTISPPQASSISLLITSALLDRPPQHTTFPSLFIHHTSLHPMSISKLKSALFMVQMAGLSVSSRGTWSSSIPKVWVELSVIALIVLIPSQFLCFRYINTLASKLSRQNFSRCLAII